jgi:CRP/FNR family transcriptional regulator, cyclic AMP receptor protein
MFSRPTPIGAIVLREDADLAAAVPAAQRRQAASASLAHVVHVPRGVWDAGADALRARGGYGLLVLDGLVLREVAFAERWGAEVLGAGDLLRPLEDDGAEAVLPAAATWRVLADLRLAVLDQGWSYRMAAYPDVAAELTGRAVRRSRRSAKAFALAQQPRLDVRLQLLLWELADRFGRVGLDGVRLDLPLTHDLLSHLAGAQRPSVSSALSKLMRAGLVRRTDYGWVLTGEAPGAVSSHTASSPH